MYEKPTTILGINPGAKCLGIAILQGSDLRQWGVKIISGKWSAERMAKIMAIIDDHVCRFNSDVIALKKINPSRASVELLSLTRKVRAYCKRKRIRLYEYSIKQLEAIHGGEGPVKSKKDLAEIIALEYPIAFNPLEQSQSDHHHLIASGLICVFKKLWAEFWEPRLEHILRNSIMALLEYPDSTLVDIPRLLNDDVFRRQVVQALKNQQVKDFWLAEFEKYSKGFKADAASPILNKIGQFLTTPPIRNIVAQKKSSFDLREVMDEKKILIVNLSKGKIGEDSTALLGAMLVTKIQLAALSRADMPEDERAAFYLYVDEVHNFLTESFADILSEARKYGLRLILAHQYIRQLDEKIRDAVFGNMGTIISFRVGTSDATYLSKEFDPVFDPADFVNLPNYHIYLKLMIYGKTSKGFSAVTLPSPEMPSHKRTIIEWSRRRYGAMPVAQ